MSDDRDRPPEPPAIAQRPRKPPICRLGGRPRTFTHDELARLIVQGLTHAQIGRAYSCSESTVIRAKHRMMAESPGALERAKAAAERVARHNVEQKVKIAEAIPISRAPPKAWSKHVELERVVAPSIADLQETARIVMADIMLRGDDNLRANAAALILKLPTEAAAAPPVDDEALLAEVLEASETAEADSSSKSA